MWCTVHICQDHYSKSLIVQATAVSIHGGRQMLPFPSIFAIKETDVFCPLGQVVGEIAEKSVVVQQKDWTTSTGARTKTAAGTMFINIWNYPPFSGRAWGACRWPRKMHHLRSPCKGWMSECGLPNNWNMRRERSTSVHLPSLLASCL